MSRLTPVPVYLRRIEDMAARMARYNMILDVETRADIIYIQRYAAEARIRVELELRDKAASK